MFDILIPESLVLVLGSSVVLSAFVMASVQRIKELPFVTKKWQIWFANLFISFLVGFLMMQHFFMFSIADALWASFFAFLGAPALYEGLKNYKPKTLTETLPEEIIDLDLTGE